MVEQHTDMATGLTALFITVLLIGVVCIVYRLKWDREYEKWFEELKHQAPYYGYTSEDIKNFDMHEWWDYFCEDLSIDEAIKRDLSKPTQL